MQAFCVKNAEYLSYGGIVEEGRVGVGPWWASTCERRWMGFSGPGPKSGTEVVRVEGPTPR